MKLFKRKKFKVFIKALIIVILSIILFNIFNNGKDIKNSQDLIKALKSKGYTIEVIDNRQKIEFFDLLTGHKAIKLSESTYINLYEFQTEEQAKEASKTISKCANPVGRAYVHWGTAVKFYRKGNIIVQYEGTDFKMLWDLRLIMGKSVASTPLDFFIFKKFVKKQ